ncbi:proline dehydrogenase family protein [Thermogemmatispora onikobensis]|uniref:proline dehydrogenase family protein n=1 Tax=Thermogemmatispora onikobensis TaxID=732234 RepID=UPI00085361C8|nr:proline dehydrogenase family protein [Thermogemmatispora onikobensis]
MLRDTLLYLSQHDGLRNFALSNRAARNFSHRFVAGEQLSDSIEVTRTLNQRGLSVALDHLGENVTDEREARAATEDYIRALGSIKESGLDANISIKLTALGLDIAQELCEENLRRLLSEAGRLGIFVCIDMESSAYTERTLDLTLRLHREFTQVGTVIQAYLYRSKDDLEHLLQEGVRVRLVKGAYKEPPNLAFPQKAEVDANYVRLMGMLLARGNFPAIATHDEAMITAACRFARDHGISREAFEFQMLYGIRRDLQERLVRQGYHVRVYVPYGSQWYPYLMRRLAERPANLMFVLSNAWR